MNNNQEVVYSPGKLITLWRVIFQTLQNTDIDYPDFALLIDTSGSLGGADLFDESVIIGRSCGLLELSDGKLILTPLCITDLLPLCNEKDPNFSVIRSMLYKIITSALSQFPWLIFFKPDPEIFKLSIPQEWLDLLEQADLFDFSKEDVSVWWNSILFCINDFDLANAKRTGDVGEWLTFNYELDRLGSDGIDNLQYRVIWVSRLSDRYGYDINSLRGNKLDYKEGKYGGINIEVKASESINETSFRFYLSRPEWNTATKAKGSYFIYCWVGIDVNTKTAKKGPFIIPAETIEKLIPMDQSSLGEWTQCRIVIDLNSFSI